MSRIVIIFNDKTGDWLTKNDFTSQSAANKFIETNEAFKDYQSYSMPTRGDYYQRQRQAIQVAVNRAMQARIVAEEEAANKVPAVEDTVVSQETHATITSADVEAIAEAENVDDGTAPEDPNLENRDENSLTPLQKMKLAKEAKASK